MVKLTQIYIFSLLNIRKSISLYEVLTISFQTFFVWAFKIVVGTWKFSMLLLYLFSSRKAGSLWGMMRRVGGVRKSIHESWLAKGLGLGLICWGLKGVQEDIPSEEASTLQIGSVAFPPGESTSPRLHSCHRLFDQDGNQNSYSPSL